MIKLRSKKPLCSWQQGDILLGRAAGSNRKIISRTQPAQLIIKLIMGANGTGGAVYFFVAWCDVTDMIHASIHPSGCLNNHKIIAKMLSRRPRQGLFSCAAATARLLSTTTAAPPPAPAAATGQLHNFLRQKANI